MKTINITLLIVIVAGLLLGACSFPSNDAGEAQSEAAQIVPENEADSSEAAEAPASPEQNTQTEAEPVDAVAEVFDVDQTEERLAQLVIRNEDLPDEYRLPPGGESTLATSALINIMGEIEAKQYIVATGRVNGWKISLERVKKDAFAPYTIENTIELFETTEGAQAALSETWYPIYNDGREFKWVDGGCNLGDQCIFYYTEKFDAASQLTTLTYEIAFTYRNTLVWILGRGLDVDITPEYMLDVAQSVVRNLDRYAQTQ